MNKRLLYMFIIILFGNLSLSASGDFGKVTDDESGMVGGNVDLSFTPNSKIGTGTYWNPSATVPGEYGDRAFSLQYKFDKNAGLGLENKVTLNGSAGALQAMGKNFGAKQFGSFTKISTTYPTFRQDFSYNSGQNVGFNLGVSFGTLNSNTTPSLSLGGTLTISGYKPLK